MGKSAQFPLHVWLPDSMEGPTPISALIHAATMVTAGIFMVARMSPLYELSETARSVVLVIGAITALFMGLVALTQFDIKRVVAYSTLSQLGYMTAALGASAYSAAMFHLMTHAFFKAVLFLAAGSVIIALHHEQDMRRMGGLRKYMPMTYWTMLIGAIASAGIPPLRRLLLQGRDHRGGAPLGHARARCSPTSACWSRVFVTATYTFRLVFMAFHGRRALRPAPPAARVAAGGDGAAGAARDPVGARRAGLIGDGGVRRLLRRQPAARRSANYFGLSVVHRCTASPRRRSGSPWPGIATAWYLYLRRPDLPKRIAQELRPALLRWSSASTASTSSIRCCSPAARARSARASGSAATRRLIDGVMVNGSARLVGWFSGVVRLVQSGLVYRYAFMMI